MIFLGAHCTRAPLLGHGALHSEQRTYYVLHDAERYCAVTSSPSLLRTNLWGLLNKNIAGTIPPRECDPDMTDINGIVLDFDYRGLYALEMVTHHLRWC
jgi:hypothetical protein